MSRIAFAAAIFSAATLPGCQSVPNGTYAHVDTSVACKFRYSADQQRRAADDLDALPDGSPLAEMIGDYGKVRQICRKAKK